MERGQHWIVGFATETLMRDRGVVATPRGRSCWRLGMVLVCVVIFTGQIEIREYTEGCSDRLRLQPLGRAATLALSCLLPA